ncbi:MAG: hypothetical protein ACREQ7_23160 [Candidatus Binatia bacterium]
MVQFGPRSLTELVLRLFAALGSDYTHRDPSMGLEFRKLLQERAGRGEIPQSAVQKILYDNPSAFYGL